MKTRITKNTQSGFSLIELMVVVAIIGILATLAIPSVQGFIGRARQSEARAGLGQLYTLAVAYTIDPSNTTWPAVTAAATGGGVWVLGYRPEGTMRYDIGWTGAEHASSKGICAGGTTPVAGNRCNGAGAPLIGTPAGVGAFPAGAVAANTFNTLGARGAIGGAQDDIWTIDQAKVMTNTQSGF